jgi:RNA polymerase sigma factor (sigma-70 family)
LICAPSALGRAYRTASPAGCRLTCSDNPAEPPDCVKANVFRSAVRFHSDHHLVELHRGGFESAYEVVVQRYRAALTRYCGRLVGQDHAEDVVQETFAVGYVSLRNDNRPIQLKAWLYRIAHNRSVDLLRLKGSTYEALDENFDGGTQPPEHFELKQRMKALIEQISALPEQERAAIVLQELEGYTAKEIAAELDVRVPVVRQLVYRARKRLRNGVGALAPRGAIPLPVPDSAP